MSVLSTVTRSLTPEFAALRPLFKFFQILIVAREGSTRANADQMVVQVQFCSETAAPQDGFDALMDSSLPALSDLAFEFEFDGSGFAVGATPLKDSSLHALSGLAFEFEFNARVLRHEAAARVLDDPTEKRRDLELARALADVAYSQPTFADLHVDMHSCSTFEEVESWWVSRQTAQPAESVKPAST